MSSKKFIARFGVDNNNHPLSNVASPTHSTDAATKGITDIIDTKAGLAFSQANLAFSQANTAFTAANNVGPQLEPSFSRANSAYDQANTGTTQAQAAFGRANNATTQAQAAFVQANTATTQAQAAYDQANTGTTQAQAAFGRANNSYSQANTATTQAQAAFSQANNSYSQANTATTQAQAAFVQANTAYTTANSKFNSIGGNITGAVTISSNLTVTGNLTVSGNVTTVSANNLILKDNMFYLNSDSSVTNPDLGFAGNYNDGIYHHAGFFRDATDGYWKVFDNYLPEPDASPYIDTSNSSFRIANFRANTITGTLFSGSGASLTSIPNGALVNSSLTINGTAVSLGSSGTVTAAAGTLTGTTLASGVTASSLTSVGTITSGTWSGSFGAVSGANLTGLTAGNLSGTIPSGVLGNSTHYVGTTAIALNRASASQTLTGVSIDGNAATATSANNIDGIAFKNSNSTSSFVVDTQGTNGIGYSTGYTLFGQTDGGVYCSTYSADWQHQINGDFRTGQIAIRGKNSGTWQAWRTVLDSSNYTSYAMPAGASATNSVDVRAPIFYDSNNTGYYIDPNSTSNIYGLTVNQTITGSVSGNAGTVGSLSVHSARNNEANKIVRTDGSGYIQAGWINTTSGDLGVANKLDRVYCSNDGYVRYLGLTDLKTQMGLSAKNNYNRRESTTDTNYWVGSFGFSGYGANETFHGGSGFFDIWAGTNYPSGTSHIHGFNALHYTTNSLGSTGGNAYGIQFASQYNQDGIAFLRSCSAGSFTSWRRFMTEDIWHNSKYFGSDGIIYAGASSRSPIFYDYNDTSYYIDPNSTSTLNSIYLSGAAGVHIDSQSTITIGNGSYVDFNNLSGIIVVNDRSLTGWTAMYITGGAAITLIGSSAGSGSWTTSSSSGSFRFYWTGSGYRFYNAGGSSATFTFLTMRLRTSN